MTTGSSRLCSRNSVVIPDGMRSGFASAASMASELMGDAMAEKIAVPENAQSRSSLRLVTSEGHDDCGEHPLLASMAD